MERIFSDLDRIGKFDEPVADHCRSRVRHPHVIRRIRLIRFSFPCHSSPMHRSASAQAGIQPLNDIVDLTA